MVAVAAVGCGSGWLWNSIWGWAVGRDWAGEEAWAGGAACTGAGRVAFSTAAAMEQGRNRGAQMPSHSPERLQSQGMWHKNEGVGQWGRGEQAAVVPLVLAGVARASISHPPSLGPGDVQVQNWKLNLLAVLLRRLVTG